MQNQSLQPLQPWPCLLWDSITLLKTKKTASSAGSFFYQTFFFFSLEKVIWKHDSSKQCPTFDYGIVKWKEVFLAGIMMFTQRDSPHQKKKSNLIGLNFEVTKRLHKTRTFLSFFNWSYALISIKIFLKSGWLRELGWLLLPQAAKQ